MLEKINYSAIEILLDELADKKRDLEKIKDEYLELTEPVKPVVVNEESDWEDYIKACRKYSVEKDNIVNLANVVDKRIKDIPRAIIKLIPPNTWVRVKDGRYIGYNTDSWPMYQPTLRIEDETSDLPVLKHINS